MSSFASQSRPHSSLSYATTAAPSNDTAYNGSEGHIDDASSAGEAYDDACPKQPAGTPTRQPLSARLLSAVSNAQPAAAALTRKGSVLHSRAKSLAAFVPKLNTNYHPASERKEHVPNKIFGDLFNGESAPIRLGAPLSPAKEKEESEFVVDYKPSLTERPSAPRRRSTVQSALSTTPPPAKTSWFGRKPSAMASPTPVQQQHDELVSINIHTSLFPHGPVDPLHPAAFNELLLNATNLLQRMQTAYKEKVDFIARIQPEMDAQKEELEEAETRARHLKLQLEDLGRRAQEQECSVQDMARQLEEEKAKADEAAQQTVRMVRRSSTEGNRNDNDGGTPTRRRKRTSGGSASDSGFESDLDSESAWSASGPLSRPSDPYAARDYEGSLSALPSQRSRDPRAPLLGASGLSKASRGGEGEGGASWAAVDSLRSENRALRRRMEEMQCSLQGCIDFVGELDTVYSV